MYQIFLSKKLLSGKKAKTPEDASARKRLRDRRLAERFEIEQQHLTVMNDQDILLIRNISAKGFSSLVSARAFERVTIDDVYSAKIRYHRKIHEFKVKVAWKAEQHVGLELYKPNVEVMEFYHLLLRPIEIANSLNQVDADFMRNEHPGMIWFHGEDSDLHIWNLEEEGLSAWQLVADSKVVFWSSVHGLKTGQIKKMTFAELGIREPGEVNKEMDAETNPQTVQLAIDILTALAFPERDIILKTLE